MMPKLDHIDLVKQNNDLRDGARLMNLMPFIGPEVDAGMKAVENSVLSLINSGQLTPDVAQQKWLEWAAYRKLKMKFEQKVRMAESLTKSAKV